LGWRAYGCEAGAEGPDTRFVVTNLVKRNARRLYEDDYCRRGQAENHIKSWKTHLAADRTSCTRATANQLRLFLHAGAYPLSHSERQKTFLACHFIVIIRGDTLDGVVGAAGEIENVSHAL
jgi:Transposase DDE domain group 1